VSGLFRTVDCVRIPVPDLDTGLAYYSGRLGHALIWRTATAAGLRLPGGDSELVLHTEGDEPETDLLVESVDEAVAAVVAAGGSVRVRAMDIPVGRVAVVADPFGNALTIVDLSKGRYRTDGDGKVTGVG
jgi:predicted enzyme related to lactoylglutathione lyase